jgi:small subunit ribosomal protein S6
MFTHAYETVILVTPVLSDDQVKEVKEKFRNMLTDRGAQINREEQGGEGMKHKRSSGYYILFEYLADDQILIELKFALKRDERVLRSISIRLR